MYIFRMVVLGKHLLCLSTAAETHVYIMDSLSANLSSFIPRILHFCFGLASALAHWFISTFQGYLEDCDDVDFLQTHESTGTIDRENPGYSNQGTPGKALPSNRQGNDQGGTTRTKTRPKKTLQATTTPLVVIPPWGEAAEDPPKKE
ncbi:hypothetical protein VNO78_30509 [Psophocarpus tetragonolobus]|uniref:Uncharacterized protein n=1 Tax=Psophocarpus tetragonolobus TaxID=3891 RepID=A0AAN9RXG2_PSOTE